MTWLETTEYVSKKIGVFLGGRGRFMQTIFWLKENDMMMLKK